MTKQLLLVDTSPSWRIDAASRACGLRGIAEARKILREIDARQHPDGRIALLSCQDEANEGKPHTEQQAA
jgi:hypothetical protein